MHAFVKSPTSVLHDYMLVSGGAERLVTTLACGLGAPLTTGFVTPTAEPWLTGLSVQTLGSPVSGHLARYLAMVHRFTHIDPARLGATSTIYSGVLSTLAVHRQLAGQRVHYCHSPPRFVYDLNDYYLDQLGSVRGLALKAFCRWYRPLYERSIHAMDVVLANSHNVANRLQRYLGIKSMVIPPPIDTARFRWLDSGNYYVSLARLEDYKRVDLIIDAFRQMPGQNLVVASGGSQEPLYRRLADGCHNIRFTSWLGDDALAKLLGQCRAVLYLPHDEDFGMSPLEAMAAGKPVIGVAEGGLLETIVPNQTGVLLAPNPGVDDIIQAVTQMSQPRALQMRTACEKRALEFDREVFLQKMHAVITH
jgi:glycosyltransferase involved in cell wall biosynthesis